MTGQPCNERAADGSMFCAAHQGCSSSPLSGWEPPWDPDRYNKNQLVRETHNCFAYAYNVLDPAQLTQCAGKGKGCQLMYHQPGGTQNRSKELNVASGRSCKVVENLMEGDVVGVQPTTFEARCPRGKSKIALVVDPGDDYHFYRQDADGWWSHKDGANPVKRFDAESQPIWDPKTAARDYRPRGSFLNYTDFCGYYCVPRDHPLKLAQGGGSRRRRRKTRRH